MSVAKYVQENEKKLEKNVVCVLELVG